MTGKFTLFTGKDGKFYLKLKSGNNQVIGSMGMYGSEGARDTGMCSVMGDAPGATIVEA